MGPSPSRSSTPPLQVIALISGGKDSLFSLLHCLYNHHTILALANLSPPPASPSPSSFSSTATADLSSHMYQTAGSPLLPHYSTLLSLPLYRLPITGSAVCMEKDYHHPDQPHPSQNGHQPETADPQTLDETESLLLLLSHIKRLHPSATALSSGAILSTYQRTRIESVARRLGLVPLSYLWQYPSLPPPLQTPLSTSSVVHAQANANANNPEQLLDDMTSVGLSARIVKVASGGLDESVLWGDVIGDRGVRSRVKRGVERFGGEGSVLGEGGEYETVVVAGWWGTGRVEVAEGEREIVRGEGGEAWVKVADSGGKVVGMGFGEGDGEAWRERLRAPGLWDQEFEALVRRRSRLGEMNTEGERELWDQAQETDRKWEAQISEIQSSLGLTISNMISKNASTHITAEEQMSGISSILLSRLHDYGQSPSDILFTTILLRYTDDFASVNTEYAKLFTTKPNPPARVTVACGNTLPDDVAVMVSVIVDTPGPHEHRQGLHVQSRSYWAPANIGPYSQAITQPLNHNTNASLVYIAGQIPLVPASMDVVQQPSSEQDLDSNPLDLFHTQALLSLQHLWRIGRATNVTWWSGAVAFIASSEHLQSKAIVAWKAWEAMHQHSPRQDDDEEEEEEDTDQDANFDVWDQRYGNPVSFKPDSEKTAPHLPDFGLVDLLDPRSQEKPSPSVAAVASSSVPGFFAAQVSALPRGCEIEWQSLGVARSRVKLSHSHRPVDGFDYPSSTCVVVDGEVTITYVGVPLLPSSSSSVSDDSRSLQARIVEALGRASTTTTTTTDNGEYNCTSHATIYTSQPSLLAECCCHIPAQIVPCHRLWGSEGVELIAGLVLLRSAGT